MTGGTTHLWPRRPARSLTGGNRADRNGTHEQPRAVRDLPRGPMGYDPFDGRDSTPGPGRREAALVQPGRALCAQRPQRPAVSCADRGGTDPNQHVPPGQRLRVGVEDGRGRRWAEAQGECRAEGGEATADRTGAE
jgi:hypothetical protein